MLKKRINPNDYLSNNAKLIVKELAVSEPPTTFSVDNIAEPSLYNPETNSIELNLKKIKNFDYYYLHELYHAVQKEQGYPYIVTGESQIDYQKTAAYIDSYVLDFNVNAFLGKHNYIVPYDEKQRKYIRELQALQASIRNKENIDTMRNVTYYAVAIAFLYFEYDEQKSKELITLSKKCSSYIWQFAEVLIKITKQGNYTNKEGCELIFKQILREILVKISSPQSFVLRSEK